MNSLRNALLLSGATLVMFHLATPASAADRMWNGSAGDSKWKTTGNWTGGVAPAPGDALFFAGTVGAVNTNDFTTGTAFGGLNFNGPGSFALWGNTVTLSGNVTNSQVSTLEAINVPLSLGVAPTIDVVSNGVLNINKPITGAFGVTKTSGGQLGLQATNTFTGPLVALGGTLSVNNDPSLGAVPASPVNGALVLNGATLLVSNSFAINPNRGIAVGPTSGAGVGTFDVLSGFTLTNSGTISDNGTNGGLAKLHLGTIVLSGSNSYSGPTLIKNGGLILDFTQPNSPTNNIIPPGSALTLGGENAGQGIISRSTILLNPKTGVTNSQSFSSTLFDKGFTIVQVGSNNLSAGNLALGAITHNTGAAVTFVPPFLSGGQGTITTTSTNVNGILGGWATTSKGVISAQGFANATNWAAIDSAGNITNYNAFTVYASGNVNTYMFATNNLQIPIGITGNLMVDADNANSTNDINTIDVDRPDSAWTFNVGAGNTLRFGKSGGILRRTDGTSTVLNFGGGSGRFITAGGPTVNTPGEIVLTSYQTDNANNNFAFNSPIVDNGTGAVTVIKAGSGYAALSSSNGYSGGTYILGGRLRWNAGNCFSTGPVFIFPGGNTYVNSGTTITNAIFMAGSGTSQEANIGAIRYGPNAAFFSGPITLIGDAAIGGQGGGGILGPISGPFKLTLCALSTVSGDTMLANSNNSWSGDTIITARNGTTAAANSLTSSNNEVIPNGLGKGNVFMQGFIPGPGTATWNMNAFSETINGLSTIGIATNCFIVNSNASAASTLTVGDNDQSGTFGGAIRDSAGTITFVKIGGGTETLTATNAYSGSTVVSNGVLALSGLGAIPTSSSIQIMSGATLDVSGKSGAFTLSSNPVGFANATFLIGAAQPTVSTLGLSNSTLTVGLNLSNPNLVASSLTTDGSSNVVNISSFPPIASYPAQFVIVQYSGLIGGAGNNFVLGTSPSAATAGYITNDTTLSSIVLVLTNGPRALTWTGNDASNPTFWDLDITTNWLFGIVPSVFSPFDSVSFDDTGSANLVNLQGALTPSVVSVNATKNYTFAGTGSISGTFDSLLKQGSGSLTLTENNGAGGDNFAGGVNVGGGTLIFSADNLITGGTTISAGTTVQVGANGGSGNLPGGIVALDGNLIFNRGADATVANTISGSGSGAITKSDASVLTLSGANSFAANVTVSAGTLRTGSGAALGTADGSTTIANGAVLDVNGQDLGAEPVFVQGVGIAGSGAIVNSGAAQINALQFVTLQSNTTLGGLNRWDIRSADTTDPSQGSLLTGGTAYDVTKVGANQVSLVGITVDSALRNLDVQQGILSVEAATTGLGDNTKTLTVESGATLQLYQLNTPLDKNIVFNGNGVTDTLLGLSSTAPNQNTIQPSTGTITLNGACVFDVASGMVLNVSGTLNGPGSLTKTGAGTNFLGGTISFAGSTTVSGGMLVLNGTKSGGAGITVGAGGMLAGTGSTAESVTNNGGAIVAGDPINNPAAKLTTGSLILNSGRVLLNADSSGDFVAANGNLALNGTVTIQLTSQNGFSGLTSGQHIVVIQYTGSLSGGLANLALGSLPNGISASLIDPTTTPGTIQVSVDHVPQPLTWQGFAPSARTVWTVGGPTNWVDANINQPSQYTNGDNVTFDDTGTNLVTLTGTLNPGSMTMANSKNYTFTGTGNITGNGGLTTFGSLTIANSGSNDFVGGITINGGTLQIGDGTTNGTPGNGAITNQSILVFSHTNSLVLGNTLVGAGAVTNTGGSLTLSGNNSSMVGQIVASGGTVRPGSASAFGNASVFVFTNATLDLNGQSLGSDTVTVGGVGVGTNGAIVNNGVVQQNALQNVTLTADTTFGGTGRWDLRSSTAFGATLLANGSPYNITKIGSNQVWMVNVNFDSAISNITIQAGLLGYQDSTTGLGDPNGNLTVAPGASLGFFDAVNPLSKIISLNGDGTNAAVTVGSGTNSVAGNVSLTGESIFSMASGTILMLNGSVSGTGSLTEIGNGTLALGGAYSWSGNTTISNGTLDLSLSASPTLSLGSGQALKGSGTIVGAVNAGAGSTITPGLSIGTLSVSGSIVLGGTTIMELDKAHGTNDLLRSTNSSIAYGGTLVVTNVGGSFTGGETYKLFDSATSSYLGAFAAIQLPTLPPGLSWNTNLSANGTISISGSANFTKPTIARISISGGNIILSGTNNTGLAGTYHVLTSTNVATPLTNWTVLTNGIFDGSGNFSTTNATGADGRQFYILQVP